MVRTNGGNNGTLRFNDTTQETVYHYTVSDVQNITKITWTAKLSGQLLVQVSQDDTNWTTVLEYEWDESGESSQGMEAAITTLNLTKLVELEKTADIYIRIADSHAAEGWGGKIHADTDVVLCVEYDKETGSDEPETPEEDVPEDNAALQEYVAYRSTLPTNKIVNATIVLDGVLDDAMLTSTPMVVNYEQFTSWSEENRNDGSGISGDVTLASSQDTEVNFYLAYDNDYLYIAEIRYDSKWCFTAQDYTKPYTGDGSMLWLVNAADAETWLAGGTMSSKPAFGLSWNAGTNGEAAGETTPKIAYFPEDDQSQFFEKTASNAWASAIKWDDTNSSYVLEVAIPWVDLPITKADMEAGNLSATCIMIDLANTDYDGDISKLWSDVGYQLQYPGSNKWHESYPLEYAVIELE